MPHDDAAAGEDARHGRLAFRPRPAVPGPAVPGPAVHGPAVHGPTASGLRSVRDDEGAELGLVSVPPSPDDRPSRLVLLLHGAGGSARAGLDLLLPIAGRDRLVLLAPQAVSATWDLVAGGYGPDVRRIDALLERVAGLHPIDRFTVGGFSDGASYAVSLGIGNGDLFDSVLAFSPGFAAPVVRHGRPRFFVSHGTDDRVLPVDRCSRPLVARLEQAGYPVAYEEFDGPHTVPAEVVERAGAWLREDGVTRREAR
jgi:predicted peptidase